jgi:predicted MFS family arabinose efflux permease
VWATRAIGFVSEEEKNTPESQQKPELTAIQIALVSLVLSAALLRPHSLEKPRKVFDFSAFRNKPFNVFAIASFAGFLGLYVPFFYIQQYSSSFARVNEDLAFYTLVILNAGSVAGRIAPALVADRIGLLNTYTASTIGATILAFAWIACRSIGGIAAALQPAVLAALCTEANMIGTWVGMGSLFSSAGILLGNPIGGQIFHGHGGQNWLGVQLWCAVTVFVCMLATVGARIARAGFDIRARV